MSARPALVAVDASAPLSPSLERTWGESLPGFREGRLANPGPWRGDMDAVRAYLRDQIRADLLRLPPSERGVAGLLDAQSLLAARVQEFLLAYLMTSLQADPTAAGRLMRGERLQVNLLPEYVEATRCYG